MNKLLTLLFLSLTIISYSQEVLDNLAPNVKWKQINTPNFKVIFPTDFESEAQRVANILETIHEPESESLGTLPRKVPVILQNQNSAINGFVSLGPRRSELFTTSPQDYNFLGTNDWFTLLATHEYRHIVQNAHSRKGFTKVMSYAFGQFTQSAMANAAVPQWFWEGDATVMETAYTPSGRGRIPAFDRVFRANLLEGKRFDYHKQYLRSYKDQVPSHYVLGYHYVNYLRRKTNNANIWGDVTGDAFEVPFIPFTFSNSLKKHTGKNVIAHYEDMMDELSGLWQKQIDELQLTSFETVTKRKNNDFTDYSFPLELSNGKLLVLKSGIADIEQFVTIDQNGAETKVFTPGIINSSGTVSAIGNTVVWNEFAYHPRWRKKSYSVIKSLNIDLNKHITLTKKTRYHSASITSAGNRIVTIEALPSGKYEIVVLDAYYGAEIKRFKNHGSAFYSVPSIVIDGTKVLSLKTTNLGKAVILIDYESGIESVLIDYSQENIGNPFISSGFLFYHSAYSGIDNVYAMDLSSKQKYQITSSKYGAYNASISNDGQTIYYNDHTVNGLDIVRIPFDLESWKPINEVKVDEIAYYQAAVDQEGLADLLNGNAISEDAGLVGQHTGTGPEKQYEVKKYSKLKGIINPHSWGPILTTNINALQAGVLSRDILSTTSLYAGYVYDAVENTGYGVGRVSYQGFYPIVDLEVSAGNRKTDFFKWYEASVEGGLRVPLLLTNNRYHREMSIGNSVGLRDVSTFRSELSNLGRVVELTGGIVNVDQNGNPIDTTEVDLIRLLPGEVANGQLMFNHVDISYYSLMKQSTRDINSKLGFAIDYEHYKTLSGDFDGRLSAMRYTLFLPGVLKHHSLYFRGGVQSRKINPSLDLYMFSNRISRPRGYAYFTDTDASSILSNYTLPIWYPDIDLGPFLNFKRIKVNLFYDYGKSRVIQYNLRRNDNSIFGEVTDVTAKYISYGAEVTFDFNFMRLLNEFEVGVRFVNAEANNLDLGQSKVELIIGSLGF